MCRIRLHLSGYPPWLLTLSRQGICYLNSVQDLQSYDLHKWFSSSPSSKDWHWCLKRVINSWFSQKAINSRVIKFLAYNGGVINRHRPRAAGYLNSGFTCQQIRYLKSLNSQTWLDFHYDLYDWGFQTGLVKSLIANKAGFLLWLSETNIMIEVFKVASAQWLLFYQWIWFILQW